MPVLYRTAGAWGPASVTEDLTAEQIDGNFWQVVQDIADKAVQGVGIANMVVVGNQLTVVLTDHTLLGPYTLPVMEIRFWGEWTPETALLANYIITNNGSTYLVLENHTSALTFDPGATDGNGNDLYGLLLSNPTVTIPSGGAVGSFLRKLSVLDNDAGWLTAALTDLSDVLIPDSPGPQEGDLLVFSGGVWTASSLATSSILLSQLGDVTIIESPPPVVGQVLTFNGTTWSNEEPAFDPTIFTPAEGQILTYKDGLWQNSNTADIPVNAGINVFGDLELDYSEGSVQRVTMSNGVVLTGVINWPPSGQFGRLVLEVTNIGAYTWQWPTEYCWPGGAEPVVSPGGRDIFALTTFNGGLIVDGSIIGQNYLP